LGATVTVIIPHSIGYFVARRLFMLQNLGASWLFWLFWALAFLGFPMGGLLSNIIIGPVTTPARALLAGAITGAIVGLVQWFVLQSRLPLPIWWVIATSVGMALGLGLSVALLGSETGGNELLWRAAITGLGIGLAQWIVLRPILPQSAIWIAVIALGWVVGWFITRSAGIDLTFKWSVFGSIGAWAFQFLTGLVLYFLIRLSSGVK
jgi:hypothetical protein